MEIAETEAGVFRAGSDFAEFLALVASPPAAEWRLPSGTLSAWVTAHFSLGLVSSAAVLTQASSGHWLAMACFTIWFGAISGLPFRLARGLPLDLSPSSVTPSPRLRSSDMKLGVFLLLTALTFQSVGQIGLSASAAFVTTLVTCSALRIVAIDAWSRSEEPREPWFYIRKLFSAQGLVAGVLLLLSTGLVFLAFRLFVDPMISEDAGEFAEVFGGSWSRSGQFVELSLLISLLSAPTVVLGEGLSTVHRFEQGFRTRLVIAEQRDERDRLAGEIHNTVLFGAKRLVVLSDSHEAKAAAAQLVRQLRTIQLFRNPGDPSRPIREYLREPLQLASESGLYIDLQVADQLLDSTPVPFIGQCVQESTAQFVANSIQEGASEASLCVQTTIAGVEIIYSDGGPAFDANDAMSEGGGLAMLRRLVETAGGSLTFALAGGRTIQHVIVPIGGPST